MFGPIPLRRAWAAAWLAVIPMPAFAQVAPASAPPAESEALDPASPLADLPDIGVDWPDLSKAPTGEDPASTARAEIAPETRYRYELSGIDGIGSDLMRQRFDAASTLRANRGAEANA